MKKKYSTLLNFALATCVATTLVACSDGDFTGSTGAQYSNPKIDIGGTVLDTNGNPIAGVTVSTQGVQTTTNSGGQYRFKNLKVTNTVGADADTMHNAVSVVISAPQGYLGATVSVYPAAQLDGTNWPLFPGSGAPGGTGGSSTGSNFTTSGNTNYGDAGDQNNGSSGDYSSDYFSDVNNYGNNFSDADVYSYANQYGTIVEGDAGDGGRGGDGGSVDLSVVNPRTTFIDGMYAEAGTAFLPALTSQVCGVLRFCDTGEPVQNAQLRLDMWAVNNNSNVEQAYPQNSSYSQGYGYYPSTTSYATPMYSTTTDSLLGQEGTFCINNVPDDSILRLYAPMYQNLDVSGNGAAEVSCYGNYPCTSEGDYITTVNEGLLNLGNVCVSSIPDSDSIRPCVADIEGWTNRDGWSDTLYAWQGSDALRFAQLHDDIDGTDGINIMFNESLRSGTIDENSVVLWDATEEEYITAFDAAQTASSTLTVTTDDPIPADHQILVYMLVADFRDLAGNFLTAPDYPSSTSACPDVFFVEDFVSLNNTPYVVAGFKIHSPDATDVDEATGLVQECLNYSRTVSMQTDLQAEYPTVFRSELSSSNTFYNMNADSDYEYRLEALADVLGCPNDDTSMADIVNEYASVSFVAPTGGGWEISGDGYCESNCGGPGDGAAETAVVSGVGVGDEACVDSYDDFDNLSAQVCVTLGDCVAPTTVLNYAYNTCGHLGQDYNSWEIGDNTDFHTQGPGASGPGYDTDYAAHICVDFDAATFPEFGDGGENTNEGTPGVCGVPTLNITCRLLKDPADAQQGAVTEPIDFYGLYTGGADGQIPAPGVYGPFPDFSLYDATEFALWVPFADTIGVAFSENIAASGGAIGGSVTWEPGIVTSWSIGNNIGTTDDGDTPDGGPDADDTNATGTTVDLVQITVADVLSLANDNHREIMDFSAAIQDTAGNPADNARVVINDLMPPFVEYAYWGQDGLTIKFNETVAPCIDGVTSLVGGDCSAAVPDPGDTDSDVVVLWDTGGNADVVSLTGATLSDVDGGTNNLLEIPAVNLDDAGVDGGENFPQISDSTWALVYDEPIYDALGFSSSAPYGHGAMTWGWIRDARGNRWFDYDSQSANGNISGGGPFASQVQYADTDGQELCNMPSFAVADVLGPFTVTSVGVSNGFADGEPNCGAGAVTHVMTYTFSHPIDMAEARWNQNGFTIPACTDSDACTVAEVNAFLDATWVNGNVFFENTLIGSYGNLSGLGATLSPDRMMLTISIENDCITFTTDDELDPDWFVYSSFGVGTGKDLGAQTAQ